MELQALIRKHQRAVAASLDALSRRSSPQRVHRARVAIRRLRTLLSAASPPLPASLVDQLRSNLKNIGNDLGAAREADVRCELLRPILQALHHTDPATATAIAERIQAGRTRARRQLRARLRSASLRQRLRALHRLVNGRDLPKLQAGQADELIDRALRQRLKKVVRGLRKDPDTPARLHALRIQVKKCRYLLEMPGARNRNGDSARIYATLRRLQDCLGELNDLVETRRSLASLRLQAPAESAMEKPLRASEKAARKRLESLRRKSRGSRLDLKPQ